MRKAGLETKEAKFEELPQATREALAPVLKAIDDFKGEHTAALAKKADRDDPLVKEKLDKATADIEALKKTANEAIETLNKKYAELQKAGGGGGAPNDAKAKIAELEAKEHSAFDSWIRTGEMNEMKAAQAAGKTLETELGIKDLSTVIFADGGAMVHPEREAEMIEILLNSSAMRQVARITEIGTQELEVPVNKKGTTAAWTTELATRVRTATSDLEMVKFAANEIYALPLVTLTMLEDAEFDVESWLHNEVVEAMDIAEEAAFVNGDGVKKPKGFLQETKVANASWAWGKLGYIVTGLSAGFAPSTPGSAVGPTAATNGYDAMIAMAHAFNPRIRRGGNLNWAMAQSSLEVVRKIKDGEGNYIVRDPVTEDGIITRILGYDVLEFEDMPAIGADTYSIALGNFYKGYQIVDRIGLQVRRDEITSPGNVIFHFRKRTGGAVRDFQAIKLLKFGTS